MLCHLPAHQPPVVMAACVASTCSRQSHQEARGTAEVVEVALQYVLLTGVKLV
jgi:hypothetical protein